MSKHPVAGVVWQTLHYLIGLQRLGYEAYYVEAGGHQPSSMLVPAEWYADRSQAAADFIDAKLRRFDLGDRWAFHALHGDGQCYGMPESELLHLYSSAALIINLHGGTRPLPEHSATRRLVYLETDPVQLQLELAANLQGTVEFLEPHVAFFTFAENYGRPGCGLPVSDRFSFSSTRQPVVIDLWARYTTGEGHAYTTIGNWRQLREVTFLGETYHWSKHLEFLKYLELPARTCCDFELALSRIDEDERQTLEEHGWRVRDALSFSLDLDAYRCWVTTSRGEFTAAKDQNIRLRSGWFSDRSATYLACGRPVVTQDTGFASVLPTGAGLFAFSNLDEAAAAIESIEADYAAHSSAASLVARDYFSSDVVLTRLLKEVGV